MNEEKQKTRGKVLRFRPSQAQRLRQQREHQADRAADDLLILANLLAYEHKLFRQALAITQVDKTDPLYLTMLSSLTDIEERYENITTHATEPWVEDPQQLRELYERAIELLRISGYLHE